MLEFLLAPENTAFSVALTVMFAIALMEGFLTFIGAGLSNLLDTIIPDIPETNLEFEIDGKPELIQNTEGLDTSGKGLFSMLGWLYIGRVPVLISLVMLLTGFGLIGYIIQAVFHSASGLLLPGWVASIISLAISVPLVRWPTKWISTLIPDDESSAVSSQSFVGRVATIITGTATSTMPAQGRLKDRHGHTHYVMIKPDSPNTQFQSGTQVLLVAMNGHIFKAIKPSNKALYQAIQQSTVW